MGKKAFRLYNRLTSWEMGGLNCLWSSIIMRRHMSTFSSLSIYNVKKNKKEKALLYIFPMSKDFISHCNHLLHNNIHSCTRCSYPPNSVCSVPLAHPVIQYLVYRYTSWLIHEIHIWLWQTSLGMSRQEVKRVLMGIWDRTDLQESEHDGEDVLGMRSQVLIGGDAVDDFKDQLP